MSSVPEVDTSTIEGQQKVLFRRFLELLATRHVKHQLIETYAQELFVSANYLTKVCRKISGKTAMQWVREYTEADIRYYLLNTDRSITRSVMISASLVFPSSGSTVVVPSVCLLKSLGRGWVLLVDKL